MNIPRPEHPKPQLEREQWINLNGEWSFEIDNGRNGIDREIYRDDASLSDTIIVPFCPESVLSGVNHTDFMYGVIYKRTFNLPDCWNGGVTKLHFGAVDYECTVYVNGFPVGSHTGGYISFSFDITPYIRIGENSLCVFAFDDTRDPMIPCGKQCERYRSSGCSYTRTTGIWQTVWLEHMPESHIERVKYYTDIHNCILTVAARLHGSGTLCVRALYDGREVGKASAYCNGGDIALSLQLAERHLWEIAQGRLYDLELSYGEDRVKSYFGLRSVSVSGNRFLINGTSVFQRLVLDQGFYPDGVYTAPSDSALVRDIELSLSCGFNGARLHEKIFEERFLYHCDRLGYIVWGEYPDWGLDHSRWESVYHILPEWTEELERDFNHPSIVCWCPHNETWARNGAGHNTDAIRLLYSTTVAIDPTRPCIDASGWLHVETDIYDVHDYGQDPASMKKTYDTLYSEDDFCDECGGGLQIYRHDKPFIVSEYGGISYAMHGDGWGYGSSAGTESEFIERFGALSRVFLDNSMICGFCYTQLTDVEQEQNGIYTYDRTPKFDVSSLKRIISAKAAIEDQ